jgi:hypothetical protein
MWLICASAEPRCRWAAPLSRASADADEAACVEHSPLRPDRLKFIATGNITATAALTFLRQYERSSTMNLLRYAWRVLVVAVGHSLSIAQNVIFAAVLLIGFLVWYVPGPHMGIDLSTWAPAMSGSQIPLITIIAIVAVRLILAPFWIHQEQLTTIADLRAQLETEPARQNSLHHAIAIEFQPTEPFMRRTVYAGDARCEVYVKITNAGNGFISECVTSLTKIEPTPTNNIYSVLAALNSLAKGEHRYVQVAGFSEIAQTGGNDSVTFAFATGPFFSGGFTTIGPPSAAAPAVITIEAKALECRLERKQFKLWVGDDRRLFMAIA